jgi:tRNA dimethylallyltransferase
MRPRIVCVVGPTASGKTALGIELAERLGGEIVSADSRQLYRRLDVGTAKPTAAERRRVPHHCLDLVDPGERFDAARFRRAADAAIADIVARGRVPLVVGGTGLYVRALLRGLCPAPPRAPEVRAALAREAVETLHRRLAGVDPETAARVGARDAVRIVRALEVVLTTGVPLSRWQRAHGFGERPYDALVVGLDVPVVDLDALIAARAAAMVDAGFLDEVRALRAARVGVDAVGYREMLACVEGRVDLTEALEATVRATRRFAKRQRTWFRAEPGIVWRRPIGDRDTIAREAAEFLAGGAIAAAAPT